MNQDAQVYQDYQGRTLFKFRTMCKSGKQVCVCVCLLRAAKSLRKRPGVKTHTSLSLVICFLRQFQAVNWSVAARGIAVKLAEANGLKYYWVKSHFIFFFFSCFIFRISCSKASEFKA